jgi:hypothetical protein
MKDPHFVLAFYPTTHGFAFVLFEGPQSPFDWGVREFRGTRKNARTLKALKKLLDRYRPEALVIENTSRVRSRRVARIKRLHRMIRHLAEVEQIETHRYTRSDVRACFASVGAIRKHEIAQAIATIIPAFAHRLPRKRKIWMSEDPRQSLFDAAALGLTFYQFTANGKHLPDSS